MSGPRNASELGAYSRRKGATAERHLCGWLRSNGFPDAERAVRTAFRTKGRESADPGDTRGTDALIVSCKDVAEERARKPSTIAEWFAELDAMEGAPGSPRLLVHKRAGHADPARWWCWTRLGLLLAVSTVAPPALKGHVLAAIVEGSPQPVRMELGHVVPLLRAAGYGEPLAN